MIILTVIGVPGAGKTTLCKKIYSIPLQYNVVHLQYDCFLPNNFLSTEELKSNNWKLCRQSIIDGLKSFLDVHINNNDSLDSSQLEYAGTKILNLKSVVYNFLLNNIKKNNTKYVLLLDDNYFYRSMRYEVFKVAKKYSLSYGTLICHCDTTVAKNRLDTRQDNLISFDTLERMQRLFEQPRSSPWERWTYNVDSNLPYNTTLYELSLFLDNCFNNPFDFVCDLENLKISKYTSMEENETSIRHKLDLILRKIVNNIMADIEYRKCGMLVSGIKKIVHSECKEDPLIVSKLLYGKDEDTLYNEIKLLFYSKLRQT